MRHSWCTVHPSLRHRIEPTRDLSATDDDDRYEGVTMGNGHLSRMTGLLARSNN